MPTINRNRDKQHQLDEQLIQEFKNVYYNKADRHKIEELLQKGANPSVEYRDGKSILEQVTDYSLIGGSTSKRMREVFFIIMEHGKNMEQESLDNVLLQCCKDFINIHATDEYAGGLNDEARIKMIKTLLDKEADLKDTDLENLMNHSGTYAGSLITFDEEKGKLNEILKEYNKIYEFANEDNVEEVKKLLPNLYKSKNINKIRKFSSFAKSKKEEIEQLKNQRDTKDNYDDMIKIDKAIEKKRKLIDTVKEFNENIQNKRNLDIIDKIMRGKNKGISPEK